MTGTTEDLALERDKIEQWIAATNTHDTAAYLDFFSSEGVLDDPSVGHTYNGPSEIADYFESYFIGYNTQTRLISIERRADSLHVEVDFTGDFPGGQTGGTFDITFDDDHEFERVRADLT